MKKQTASSAFLFNTYYPRHTKINITKTHLFKYFEKFTIKKGKFTDKNCDIFHIPAENIDCGYSLEPPRRVPTIYVF